MSEYINNSESRVQELKKLLSSLHEGKDLEKAKEELKKIMGVAAYGEVVQAEQELISEGMPETEILKYCDLHSEALKGNIHSKFSKEIPKGHPIDILINENRELEKLIGKARRLITEKSVRSIKDILTELNGIFNLLMDIEKHYVKKENLIFPFLEKNNITGPPMVMWGKHDETRGLLKSAHSGFQQIEEADGELLEGLNDLLFEPVFKSIEEMIFKEESILFPMCIDTLTDLDWYTAASGSDEVGYCLYYPEVKWKPEFSEEDLHAIKDDNKIKLSSGAFSAEELESMFNSLPLDFTFVDKDDKVRYFSEGTDRVFQRNRAILGREVQYCHPPSSVHIVNKILEDFKTGKESSAKFWIDFHGKYVHIAYYAVRNSKGEYIGTVELTQDIQEYKNLEGERRILEYD